MSIQTSARNSVLLAAIGMVATACGTSPVEKPMTNQGEAIQFNKLDRNADGVLTPDELPANHELLLHFADYDRNGDGHISTHEFSEYIKRLP
jgi:Ca2+-binding EF-hand superfamily protein